MTNVCSAHFELLTNPLSDPPIASCWRYTGLQNDHLDIMKKIEYGIYDLHARAKTEGKVVAVNFEPKAPVVSPAPAADDLAQKYADLKVFALVNSVAQLSPAFKADLREGDKILKFGTADGTTGGFSKVAPNVVENEDVLTVVKRHNEDGTTCIKELTLKPAKWAGPGLLGCHLLPASL